MMAPALGDLGFMCWARGFCNYAVRVSGQSVCVDCGWVACPQPTIEGKPDLFKESRLSQERAMGSGKSTFRPEGGAP